MNRPSWWLPIATALVLLAAIQKAPAIDEETWLWLGHHVQAGRPYDWVRAWPPYDQDGFVFAHPPGFPWWVRLWRDLPSLPWIRIFVGLPWALLLGWAVGRLAELLGRAPAVSALVWLLSATVVLGLQDSLLVDLPATALATAGVTAWVLSAKQPRWLWGAGFLFGLGLCTKYPVALSLVPIFFHGIRTGRFRQVLLVVGIALAMLFLLELWIEGVYGRWHLYTVWARREEIAAGPLSGRALGVLLRAALLPAAWALSGGIPGAALAALGAWLVPWGTLDGVGKGIAAITLLGGSLALGRSVRAVASGKSDELLLGSWVLAIALGVVATHNYAASRYLLPAAAPLALLLQLRPGRPLRRDQHARAGHPPRPGQALQPGQVPWGTVLATGASGLLALALAIADLRYAGAGAEVAALVARKHTSGTLRFAGEWSFREGLETAGWSRYRPGEVLAAGAVVAVVDHAGAGMTPPPDWVEIWRVESGDTFPLRVVGEGVGLYAETLGFLPFGLGEGPLEGATGWEVR